jgi:hypothetical protein
VLVDQPGLMKARVRFREHRKHAAVRGIPFLINFQQWWLIWEQSGHWHERGRGRGKYVMARFADRGPYAVGNVKVILWEENVAEQEYSPERRAAIAQYNRDRGPRSAATRAKISARLMGHRNTVGYKPSIDTRRRQSIAARRRNANPAYLAKLSAAAKEASKARARDTSGRFA